MADTANMAVEREEIMDDLFDAFFDFDDDEMIDDFEETAELAMFASLMDEDEEEKLEVEFTDAYEEEDTYEDELQEELDDDLVDLDDFDL